jgi:hypothetical protein
VSFDIGILTLHPTPFTRLLPTPLIGAGAFHLTKAAVLSEIPYDPPHLAHLVRLSLGGHVSVGFLQRPMGLSFRVGSGRLVTYFSSHPSYFFGD